MAMEQGRYFILQVYSYTLKLPYSHSRPCDECNGKAVLRATEYRHWKKASTSAMHRDIVNGGSDGLDDNRGGDGTSDSGGNRGCDGDGN